MTFWPQWPKWPQIGIWPYNMIEGLKLINMYEYFLRMDVS